MGLSVPFLVKIEVLKDIFNDLVTVFNGFEQGEEFEVLFYRHSIDEDIFLGTNANEVNKVAILFQ